MNNYKSQIKKNSNKTTQRKYGFAIINKSFLWFLENVSDHSQK